MNAFFRPRNLLAVSVVCFLLSGITLGSAFSEESSASTDSAPTQSAEAAPTSPTPVEAPKESDPSDTESGTPTASSEASTTPTSEMSTAPSSEASTTPTSEASTTPASGASSSPSPSPDAGTQTPAAPETYPTLQLGDESQAVRDLQNRLIELCYMTGEATGIFDEITQTAVSAFQTQTALTVTGIADNETQTALYAEDAPIYTPVNPETTPGTGGMPGGGMHGGGSFGGGSFGGGSFSGGMTGTMPEGQAEAETQGFRITPGEALTDQHASGSRDTRIYGTVALEASAESMHTLTLGGETLDISLGEETDGFTVSVPEDGSLVLTGSDDTSGVWHINGASLKLLAASGVTTLRLQCESWEFTMPTSDLLSGNRYIANRIAGIVQKDYDYTITLVPAQDGATVFLSVSGEIYGEITGNSASYALNGVTYAPVTESGDE